jgi:hypothetical protein
MARIGGALFLILLVLTVIGEVTKFRVRLTPQRALAGASMKVWAFVPKDKANRQLATAITCDQYERTWQEQLNGEQAPLSRESSVGPMPSGHCEVYVTRFYLDPTAKDGYRSETTMATACFVGGEERC